MLADNIHDIVWREELDFLALPLGQLPILKIDGVMYCQTQAINAYCGKLAKLQALGDIEELKNHMMNET